MELVLVIKKTTNGPPSVPLISSRFSIAANDGSLDPSPPPHDCMLHNSEAVLSPAQFAFPIDACISVYA